MTRHFLAPWLLAASLPILLIACAKRPPDGERFYVSNEHGDTVSVVDVAASKVVRTIAVGRRPRGLALSSDGATLYVAVSGSPIGGPGVDESKLPPSDHRADGIAVVDVASGKRKRMLRAGDDPETFALSADGRTLFVSNEESGEVSAVAVDGGRPTMVQKVGEQPEGVAVTPDGARLFVACEASDHVAMLDGRTLKPLRMIALEGRPRGALISRDGARLFVSVENAGKLAVISTSDGSVERSIDLRAGDKSARPMGMVEGPDHHLYVTTGRGGQIVEVDPAAGKMLRAVGHVGARPWGITLSKDGTRLLTANGPSNDVSIVQRATLAVVRRIGVGAGPWGVTE